VAAFVSEFRPSGGVAGPWGDTPTMASDLWQWLLRQCCWQCKRYATWAAIPAVLEWAVSEAFGFPGCVASL